jgi:NAD(P)-dependent dehydrogenase (short-subunit alcohol dehydrogenase family)
MNVYSATKAAVRSFARTWTNDLRDRRIRVNAGWERSIVYLIELMQMRCSRVLVHVPGAAKWQAECQPAGSTVSGLAWEDA